MQICTSALNAYPLELPAWPICIVAMACAIRLLSFSNLFVTFLALYNDAQFPNKYVLHTGFNVFTW